MFPTNNNTKIMSERKNLIQVTLVEIFSTFLSSTRGIINAKIICEDLILPRFEDLQSTRSNSKVRPKLKEVMESTGTDLASWESKIIQTK